jgi:hypothetical protein
MNTDLIKHNSGAHDIVDGQHRHKGTTKGVSNTAHQLISCGSLTGLIPTAECRPAQHQGIISLIYKIKNVFGHRPQRLEDICSPWKVMYSICQQRDKTGVMFKMQ